MYIVVAEPFRVKLPPVFRPFLGEIVIVSSLILTDPVDKLSTWP